MTHSVQLAWGPLLDLKLECRPPLQRANLGIYSLRCIYGTQRALPYLRYPVPGSPNV